MAIRASFGTWRQSEWHNESVSTGTCLIRITALCVLRKQHTRNVSITVNAASPRVGGNGILYMKFGTIVMPSNPKYCYIKRELSDSIDHVLYRGGELLFNTWCYWGTAAQRRRSEHIEAFLTEAVKLLNERGADEP